MKYYLDHRDKYINYMKIYNKYFYLLNRQNLNKTQKEKENQLSMNSISDGMKIRLLYYLMID
jgi:hypothetical protein